MKKLGLFALVILSAITVYALPKANAEEYNSNVQERTEYLQKRSESLKKLHKLGLMFITYASGHNGKYPDTLQDVQAYAEDVNNFKLIIENVEYLGKGKTVTIDPQAVIGYDKELLEESDSKGTNVLYNDCHVAFEKADLLKEKGIVAGQDGNDKRQLSFGSVNEFIIHGDTSKQSAIDFDTGTLYSSGNSETLEEFNNWLKSTGIDAVSMYTGIYGLCGFEMIIVPVEKEMWDISPEQVIQFLSFGKPGTPANISGKGELPATYLFKTREGGMGVLQITGFSDNPKGVNIRYKMIENPAGQKAQIEIEARILFINESLLANLKDANVITDVNCGNLLNESQCALLLRSTQAHNTSKLLTAPRVTVLDGEEGSIAVTKETQYIAGYNEPNESSMEPLPKIESVETGLKLKVLPKLLEKTDKIKLDINFEYTEAELQSYLYNGKYGFQRPRKQVIQLSSSVVVSDGQTVLAGGQNAKTKDGSQIIVVLIKAQKTNSAEAQTTAELENNLKSGCQ